MSWVSPGQVRSRWPGAPADDACLQAWVDDAETIITTEYPWVDQQLGTDPTLQPVVVVVVSRMLVRALSAPFGVRSESVGDTSTGYADNGGALYLTDADRALIAATGPQSAYTFDAWTADGLTADWRWWWARGWDSEVAYRAYVR